MEEVEAMSESLATREAVATAVTTAGGHSYTAWTKA